MRLALLFTLLALLILPATAQSTRVYKWQDEHGNVHYSDRLPSDRTAQNREVLNANGVRINTLDTPQLTPMAAAQRQELLRNAQRDTALAVTFENEDALRRVQDERIAVLRSGLTSARANIERIQASLAQHEGDANAYISEGKSVPAPIRINLERVRQMLAEQEAETAKLEQRYNETLLEHRAEIERYRELAGTR
ncbi:DUF4124 domain-containing protein [Pseudofulvimonas gallinarii]|uniref:Uncharacterized protein DUF4124 n=1 Tax=Pseudofulvimonas gallinarii TaxID=634155 RepID=A0A4V2UW65_9GAMM|nr:DUF4124 domain-containing protein [Pseudofulvimonas gallinarii]TCS98427.1 uncharacterized protein DUF4124 [Pseudofulvimonas gallinarii]